MLWHQALKELGVFNEAQEIMKWAPVYLEAGQSWALLVGRENRVDGVYYTVPDDPNERKAMGTMLLMLLSGES